MDAGGEWIKEVQASPILRLENIIQMLGWFWTNYWSFQDFCDMWYRSDLAWWEGSDGGRYQPTPGDYAEGWLAPNLYWFSRGPYGFSWLGLGGTKPVSVLGGLMVTTSPLTHDSSWTGLSLTWVKFYIGSLVDNKTLVFRPQDLVMGSGI
jgi:hypothetical protein